MPRVKKEQNTRQVCFYIDEDTYEKLKKSAEYEGYDILSAYIRKVVKNYLQTQQNKN